ncbi:MAG: hypothetical protein QXK37_06505 [Candidatus Woesearchaeota archaeon]
MTKHHGKIFIISFIVTSLIFILGIATNYIFDFARIDEIESVIAAHEIDSESYLLEKETVESMRGDKCQVMTNRMIDLKNEIHQVGAELTNYGSKTMFKKEDLDYLKREYFLLQLNFLTIINKLNKECGASFIPILFFYKIDDPDSLTQGYVLEDLSQQYRTEIVVLSFDKDYEDEPILNLLKKKYNITTAPTVIIENQTFTGLTYTGELNSSVYRILHTRTADPIGKSLDFTAALRNTHTNISDFVEGYMNIIEKNNPAVSNFTKAEIMFMLGRITKNDTMICNALQYYDGSLGSNYELNAVVYETIASIGCGRNTKAFYIEAAKSWEKAGNNWRAQIDREIAYKYVVTPNFETSEVESYKIKLPENAKYIIIGSSSIMVDMSDRIISQVDRVNRDWLTWQIESPDNKRLLRVFSEQKFYNKTELMPEIGWHEGARIEEITKSGAMHDVAFGTIVARKDNVWYAPDENGVFRFHVPSDKVIYPTTRFLQDDLAVIIDTHGINMLVEQSVRKNATVVVGCCDDPGKVKAAIYLSNKGKDVVCFTDKYLPLAIGSNANILGSPPISTMGKKIILGHRPIKIGLDEKIVVMNSTSQKFGTSYYETSAIYFSQLQKSVPLKLDFVAVNDFGEMHRIIDRARQIDARVVAVRVFNSQDYLPLKEWLNEDHTHRAILFHSTSYPYGYMIMNEFPLQTTFDDINPRFA